MLETVLNIPIPVVSSITSDEAIPDGEKRVNPLILVVDDEPPLLRLLEFLLSRQGYSVQTAVNGENALEIVRREHPDLIVLDVMMPRMDGYQVAAAIRADSDIAETPILMLTARAQEEDRERGLAVGVNTYMTKPFEPERLAEVIASFFEPVPMKSSA